jgi:hypothetical protein
MRLEVLMISVISSDQPLLRTWNSGTDKIGSGYSTVLCKQTAEQSAEISFGALIS